MQSFYSGKFLKQKKVEMQAVKEMLKMAATITVAIIAAQQIQKALKLN